MTHEVDQDDGDLEIEEWEIADAALAASGMSVEERFALWESLKSPEAQEHDRLIGAVQEEHGVSAEEAQRILRALDGKVAT